MNTCVYYDLEAVAPEDVQAVLSAEGTDVIHVHPAGADWPDGSAVATSVPSHRDAGFRNELMSALDAMCDVVRANRRWRGALTVEGVDLLEVARYEWFYALAPGAHRVWALRHLLSEHRPHRVLWVGRYRMADERPFGGALNGVLAPLGVEGVERSTIGRAPERPPLARQLSRRVEYRRRRRQLVETLATVGTVLPGRLVDSFPARPRTPVPVLGLDQYPHTAKALASMLEALPDAGHQSLFVGTDRQVAAAAHEHLPAATLESLATPRARMSALAKRVQVSALVPGTANAICAAGVEPFGPLSALLEPALRSAAFGAWRQAAYQTMLAADVLAATRPKVVATTSIVASSVRAAALWRHGQGQGPTVWIQHGLLRTDAWKTHVVQDRYLTWGERDRRKLMAAGVPESSIEVTGSPLLERLSALGRGDASSRERRPLTITYLPSRSGGNHVSQASSEAMLKAVVRAVKELPDADLVVKLHPGDRSKIYEEAASRDGFELERQAPSGELMARSDLVIVSTSTAGIEACALDRDVVVLAFPGIEVVEAYGDYGAALMARDENELVSCLRALCEEGPVTESLRAARKLLVDDMFAGLSPFAASRITGNLMNAVRDF